MLEKTPPDKNYHDESDCTKGAVLEAALALPVSLKNGATHLL
jgi:hypothetical protein